MVWILINLNGISNIKKNVDCEHVDIVGMYFKKVSKKHFASLEF
jgi:hypothetical protein